jgi:hypothetical protein
MKSSFQCSHLLFELRLQQESCLRILSDRAVTRGRSRLGDR